MFTGLIETIGTIRSLARGDKSILLGIVPKLASFSVSLGDSVAVDGVCLTVESQRDTMFYLRAVEETLQRTMLGSLKMGSMVNLERALLAHGRLDGHIVQGHVDGLAKVVRLERRGDALLYSFSLPPHLLPYVAEKGSVALNGISLTVSALTGNEFTISIIPHTLKNTTLISLQVGSEVNFECDVLARYVARLMQFDKGEGTTSQKSPSLLSMLERTGF